MMRNGDLLQRARMEALFASAIPTGAMPGRAELAAAIRAAVRTYRGVRGCAAEMGAAYGESPETAIARIRWARGVVAGSASRFR